MKDETVRKLWLILLMSTSLSMIAYSVIMKKYDPNFHLLSPVAQYTFFGVQAVLWGSFAWSIYHCAYKKRGTKFLLFCMGMTVFGAVMNVYFYLTGRLDIAFATIPYYTPLLVLSQLQGVAWFILCWKMRKINQQLISVN